MISVASIILSPVLPVWLIVPIVLAVGYGAWRTYGSCAIDRVSLYGLWGLRLAAILILVWLLLQGERRTETTERENPVLAVAVDVSASMTDNPSEDRKPRDERARSFLDDGKIRRLTKDYRVLYYTIGSDLEEIGEQPPDDLRFNGPASHVTGGLNRLADRLRAENLAAVILLSDGLERTGDRLSATALGAPVFIPELEEPFTPKDTAETDWFIADVAHPKMMVVNWKGNVDVLVRNRGAGAATIPVHLRAGGRTLRSSMLEFADGEQFKQVSFTVEPTEEGQILYEVEIEPGRDAVEENNRREFLIEVTDPKNRVLYLEGAPRWEFKFLKRAILSEKNYRLSAYVQGGEGAFISFDEMTGRAGGGEPVLSAESLSQYRVVILGDMERSALTPGDAKNLRDFVDRGGGLLLAGAAKSYGANGLTAAESLGDLLPATTESGGTMKEGKFAVDLTAAGRSHPALADLAYETNLPPVLSFWSPTKAGPFSTVLIASADDSPILVTRRFGQGRVAMVLSDSLWRWQLGSAEGGTDKSLYGRFITQLIYWLAPGEKEVDEGGLLQVLVAKGEIDLREKVTIGAVHEGTAPDGEALSCKITLPDGRILPFPMLPATLGKEVGLSKPTPGFKCFFTPQDPGRYNVTVATPDGTRESSLVLLAAKPRHERTGAPINRPFLDRVAAETGGSVVPWRDRYALFERIPFQARELTIVREYSIWDRWWWLVILLALFSVEWWWRRRLDLV